MKLKPPHPEIYAVSIGHVTLEGPDFETHDPQIIRDLKRNGWTEQKPKRKTTKKADGGT